MAGERIYDPVTLCDQWGRHKFAPLRVSQKVALTAPQAAEKSARRAALIRHHAAKRRAAKIRRTPAWADLSCIRGVYERAADLTAETGILYVVDHEIPLQGDLVSGLHVHTNLRPITARENSSKRNSFAIV